MKNFSNFCGWLACASAAVGLVCFTLGAYAGSWFSDPATVTTLCRVAAGSLYVAVLAFAGYKCKELNRDMAFFAAFTIIGGLVIGGGALVAKATTPMSYEMWGMMLYPSVGMSLLGIVFFAIFFADYARKNASMGFWHTVQATSMSILCLALATSSMGLFKIIPLIKQDIIDISCFTALGCIALALISVFMQSKWVHGKQVM